MKQLFLLDANALIHRLYHALPPLTTKNGEPAGALYGLSSVLLKIAKEEKPDFIMAFFDRPEPTFRKAMYEEYKIHRPKADDALVSQIIGAREIFDAFKIKTMEAPGYEADDLISGAVFHLKREPNLRISILTGDMDLLQLVDGDKVIVKSLRKGISETVMYDENAVVERFGVKPNELPEYKGLVGDTSDNIPGVIGIGPKTAAGIIQKYGTLKNFLEKGGGEKGYDKIKEQEKQALLSRDLAILNYEADFEIKNLSEISCAEFPGESVIEYLKKQGFESLIKRMDNNRGEESSAAKKPEGKKKSDPRQGTLL